MPRFRDKHRQNLIFLPLDLEKAFPEGSLEWLIRDFVDHHVDLKPFYARYRNDAVGRPAVRPESLLKVLFYAVARGESSLRLIEARLKTDVGYMYLSRAEHFDHTTMARFMKDHFEAILACLARLLQVLDGMGAVDWSVVGLDGTRVPANASKQRTKTRAQWRAERAHYEALAEVLLQRLAALDEGDEGEWTRLERQLAKYEEVIRRLDEIEARAQEAEAEAKAKGREGKRAWNGTDPNSRMLRVAGGGTIQGYNVQVLGVQGDIIVWVEPTDAGKDSVCLEPMIERLGTLQGSMERATKGMILADRGYMNLGAIYRLTRQGWEVVVPLQRNCLKYQVERRPDGVWVYYGGRWWKARRGGKAYRVQVQDEAGQMHLLTIPGVVADDPAFWHAYKERLLRCQPWVRRRIEWERLNASFKRLLYRGRFWRRTRWGVQLEAILAAIAHNLRWLQRRWEVYRTAWERIRMEAPWRGSPAGAVP